MRYYKTIGNGNILSIGTGVGGGEITEAEYSELLGIIRNRPTAPDGFDYRLKADLTWELAKLPPVEPEDEEAGPADYEAALQELGVKV